MMKEHFYLFIAGSILLTLFLVYVFICGHRKVVEGDMMWEKIFREEGLTPLQISKLSHDDSMWYYDGKALCVAYGGDFQERCRHYESYCAGGDKYGNEKMQILAIKEALRNGGEHPKCPLIYRGAN